MIDSREIEKISKSRVSVLVKLHNKKWRQREGLFVAEGKKCVEDLMGIYQIEMIVATNVFFEENREMMQSIPFNNLRVADAATMQKLTSLSTAPGVIGVFKIPKDNSTDFSWINLNREGLYILLDGLQDPGNLGTIVRTAHWFGVDAIYASDSTVDIFNAKTIQATMGSMGHVPVFYGDLRALIENNASIPLIGTFMKGESIYNMKWPKGVMILMGNEGRGVSDSLSAMSTVRVTIPPFDASNHSESLNVGVATAIMLASYRGQYPGVI